MGAVQHCISYPEVDARLRRLEEITARLEALLDKLPEVQEWREGVAAWMRADHEQTELLVTMLLGLRGLADMGQRPPLPEPPEAPDLRPTKPS